MEQVLTQELQRKIERTLGLSEKGIWGIFISYTKERLKGRDGASELRRHFVNQEPFEAELRDRVEGEFLLYSKRNGLLDTLVQPS